MCMSVSYDGLYLATISADKNMKVYDVRSFGTELPLHLYNVKAFIPLFGLFIPIITKYI